MRIRFLFCVVALAALPRLALAQDAISDRLGLARFVDEPTAFFGSVRCAELFGAVETSRFWQKPLVRRALREIPPEVLAAIVGVLDSGKEEVGVWIPAKSAEPMARLVGLLPDAAAAALISLTQNAQIFEGNGARKARLLETLEKGIIPTLVAFDRVEGAQAIVDRAWAAIQEKGRFPPGVRALSRDGRIDIEVHVALVAMPNGVLETTRGAPIVRTLGEGDLARFKAACEATKIVASLAAAGPYLLVSVGPDTTTIERLAKNVLTPPAAEAVLSGAPSFARMREDMVGKPTVALAASEGAGATNAMVRELGRGLADLKVDLAAHQRELAVGGAPPTVLQMLARGESMLAQFEAYLAMPAATTGGSTSVMLLDQGLRATSRALLAVPAQSAEGGDALAEVLPVELLAFAVSAKLPPAAGMPGMDLEGFAGNMESQIEQLVAAGTLAPEQAVAAKSAIATFMHMVSEYTTRVEPTIGGWSALAATASGTLTIPRSELSLAIPEVAYLVQMTGDAGVRGWWTDSFARVKALLEEVAPGQKIELPAPSTWEHEGVTIAGYDIPALVGGFTGDVVPNAFYAKDHLVFSTSLRLSRSIIDRLGGRKASVKDRPAYSALAGGVFARPAFDTRMFVDASGWVDYAQKVTDVAIASQKLSPTRLEETREIADAVFDTLRVLEGLGASHGREGPEAVTRAWLRVRD